MAKLSLDLGDKNKTKISTEFGAEDLNELGPLDQRLDPMGGSIDFNNTVLGPLMAGTGIVPGAAPIPASQATPPGLGGRATEPVPPTDEELNEAQRVSEKSDIVSQLQGFQAGGLTPAEKAQQAELLSQFKTRQGELETQRQGSIQALQDRLQAEEGRGRPPDLRPLAGFVDSMFGSKLAGTFGAPESEAQRQTRLGALEQSIAGQQQGLTKSQIDALKAQMGFLENKGQARTDRFRRAEERRERFKFDDRKIGLAKELRKSGLPGVMLSLDQIDDMVPGGLEGFKGEKIEGIGGLESAKLFNQLSDTGKRNRNLARSIGNQFIKARTGAAMSNQEAKRILGELGLDSRVGDDGELVLAGIKGFQTGTSFVEAMRIANATIRADASTLRGAFGETVWDEVMGSTKESIRKSRKKLSRRVGKPKKKTAPDFDNMTIEEVQKYNREN